MRASHSQGWRGPTIALDKLRDENPFVTEERLQRIVDAFEKMLSNVEPPCNCGCHVGEEGRFHCFGPCCNRPNLRYGIG